MKTYFQALRSVALPAILLWVTAAPLWAAVWATITLSDGRTVEGVYLGGSEEIVRLGRPTDTFAIPIQAIKTISFGERTVAEPEVHLDRHAAPTGTTDSTRMVPAAVALKVKLGQPLSSALSPAGSTFMAIVAEDVFSGEEIVIRKGLAAYGRVAAVQPGGRLRGEPQLSLVLDSLHFPGGTRPLKTRVWIASGSHSAGDSLAAGYGFLTADNQLALPAGAELEFVLVQPVLIPK